MDDVFSINASYSDMCTTDLKFAYPAICMSFLSTNEALMESGERKFALLPKALLPCSNFSCYSILLQRARLADKI